MSVKTTSEQASQFAHQYKYHSNKNIIFKCVYHVVFCPKYRRDVLTGGVDDRLKELILETAVEHGFDVLSMEVMPDHVHLLLDVDPQFGIHKAIKRIKGYSSRVLREEYPHLKRRLPTLWTNSYFCATTGGATLEIIKKYVENQKLV